MASFQTVGGSFSVDRTGLFTGSVRYVFDSRDEAEKFSASYEEASFQQDESGAFWVGDYRATDAAGMVTEELDFSLTEAPIQSHPNFQGDNGISVLYGYNAALKEFSPNLPDASLESDIQTSNNAAGGDNPLYGTTSYLSMGAIFRKNQTVKDLGDVDGLLTGIGMISAPDSELISIPDLPTRNWLKLAPKITSRAGVFEVSQQWQLSGAGGWNSKIYQAA